MNLNLNLNLKNFRLLICYANPKLLISIYSIPIIDCHPEFISGSST
ncbi:hypothetical protein NMS_2523 [Nonlabens marinus S1-08]|uniref:Uncharacterized protein n=1 Tax=Nonlabens marinus S1-08 TaxID=1454201 RepID=W8VXU4_9FLAO|nr:hypothetical protein NMS_2523 [Nonlabens marinus S1-08]